jgi:phosphoglycolate phosphatase
MFIASSKSALSPIRAVIIDLDGTMLDTVPDFHLAINRMRAELQLAPIAQDAVGLLVGKGSENLIRGVLALNMDAGAVEQHFEAAMSAYQRTTWPSMATTASCTPT